MQLFGSIIRIYDDAGSPERQLWDAHCWHSVKWQTELLTLLCLFWDCSVCWKDCYFDSSINRLAVKYDYQDIQMFLFSRMTTQASTCVRCCHSLSFFVSSLYFLVLCPVMVKSQHFVLEKKVGFFPFFRSQGSKDLCHSRCPLTRFWFIAFCVFWARRVDASAF